LIILLFDIGLLFFDLSSPFDGFHGFQEAWYAAIGKNYSSHSLLMPTTYDGSLDLNVPPLLSHIILLSFSLLGPTEFAARLVPVFFAFLSLFGVYLLATSLLRRRTGLEAAVLFASTPIFLILGRSVQTDIVYVSLSLFSVYFYIRSRGSGKRLHAMLAGLFMGAALFSKQFAVLPLIAIVLWELLGKERYRLVKLNFALFAVVSLIILVPFYGYHLVHDPGYLLEAQLHGSASKASIASPGDLVFLVSEMVWGCSPLFFMGTLAGVALMLVKLNESKKLVGVVIACYFVFYLFLHRHTYYFFGIVPFLCLGFTELSERLPKKAYGAVLIATLVTATSLSAYQLAGCKYGRGEFKEVGEYLKRYERPVVVGDESIYHNYRPLFTYYAENATLLLRDAERSPAQQEALRETDGVFFFSEVPLGGTRPEIFPVRGVRYGIRFAGNVYIHVPPNLHFFTPTFPTELKGYTILAACGPVVKLEQISFYLVAEPIH